MSIEMPPGKPRDAHDALAKPHASVNKNPCFRLEHIQDPSCVSPSTLQHYDSVLNNITHVTKEMQERANELHQGLAEANIGEGEPDVRAMIDTLAQPGPTYREQNGKRVFQTNPRAKYLLLFNLIPGLVNGQMPVVTVNALNILRDVTHLNRLTRIHNNNPKAAAFLQYFKNLLLSYGNEIDPHHMDLEKNKQKKLNSATTKAFGNMSRATAFVLLVAGTLVTGILSIFGRESPTSAALYGALAFLVANKGILTPKKHRDADLALSILNQTGLHGAEGGDKLTLARLCRTILNLKDETTKKLLRKPTLTPEELQILTENLTKPDNSAAAKYLTTKSQRDGLASLFGDSISGLSKGAEKHVKGFIGRVLTGQNIKKA